MSKFILLSLTALLLSSCLEQEASTTEIGCFDILQAKDSVRAIKFNKCTGETWMLTYIALTENNKPTGEFTFRWSPLLTEQEEPLLSYRK